VKLSSGGALLWIGENYWKKTQRNGKLFINVEGGVGSKDTDHSIVGGGVIGRKLVQDKSF